MDEQAFMRLICALALLSSSAFAGEYAVLTTGARIRADRHETDGGKVRLYSGQGYVEMDASRVQSFETFDDPPSAAPAPAPASVPEPAKAAPTPLELADAAAQKYGLPQALVRSVMAAESAGKTNAVSPKGAIGLMQLMPGTAKQLGVDPNDPAQNVDGGARYLRDLVIRFDGRLWHVLAAYNAGPGAVQKYGDIPPYRETINYVMRIDKAYNRKAGNLPAPSSPSSSN
jgi:soluble lytic murein transglycosylase-like protein